MIDDGDPGGGRIGEADGSGAAPQMPGIGELDYIGSTVKRALFLALVIIALSLVAPGFVESVLEFFSEADRLRTIRPSWFLFMLIAEVISFLCIWWLTRIVLPEVSWFVAGTSQVTANSVSRILPGGAAIGGATLYRMLAVSGVTPAKAGGALAATSILSTAALFAIPAIGGAIAVFGAPIPEGLLPVAVASFVLFMLAMVVAATGLRYTRPLLAIGLIANRLARAVGRLIRRPMRVDARDLVRERDRLVSVLGDRWPQAVAASALNWTFDYLVLVAALYAVDADPRLSLVMVAYAAAAVLAMIPITPGGLGFVEVGLTSALVLSGINAQDAAVAALAYRVVSYWLPMAAGPAAWMAFRRRYPRRTAAI
ncbi:MAG: flippase-like domain-containing protein [Acidimicrobiales bacterium]|nr:MAG: flippase-like domain-containing protein [Acidimicrobiales bacterium]